MRAQYLCAQVSATGPGFDVSYKENIGSAEIVQSALTRGKINSYPEYMGPKAVAAPAR